MLKNKIKLINKLSLDFDVKIRKKYDRRKLVLQVSNRALTTFNRIEI